MTLNKHQIDGLSGFQQKTMLAHEFENFIGAAGYEKAGSGQGKAGRVKIWWSHKTYCFMEFIYSGNKSMSLTIHPFFHKVLELLCIFPPIMPAGGLDAYFLVIFPQFILKGIKEVFCRLPMDSENGF
jgi:hypothetical protein